MAKVYFLQFSVCLKPQKHNNNSEAQTGSRFLLAKGQERRTRAVIFQNE